MTNDEALALGVLLSGDTDVRRLTEILRRDAAPVLDALCSKGFKIVPLRTGGEWNPDGFWIFAQVCAHLDAGSRQMAHDALDAPDPEARSDEFDDALLEAERSLS